MRVLGSTGSRRTVRPCKHYITLRAPVERTVIGVDINMIGKAAIIRSVTLPRESNCMITGVSDEDDDVLVLYAVFEIETTA
jgi:hypothetical protein